MGAIFSTKKRRNYHYLNNSLNATRILGGNDMLLEDISYERMEDQSTKNIMEKIDEQKSEISNTNNIIKYIEENLTGNIKLLSADIHHMNEEITNLKDKITALEEENKELQQINRIISKKLNPELLSFE
jgi:chromosome segregation ATPase